ncbi:MAG: YIP1 family protein [Myxococcales bacterium]|nr:YIP1 family protein [Myxococcales bacterium]
MQALSTPLKAVIDPVGAIPRAVEERRWVAAVLVLAVCTALSGVTLALKVDASRAVISKMQMSGELMKATEREVEEEIQQAQRVAIVSSVAKGLFVVPLVVLLIAAALKFTSWLLGKKALFVACFTAAALALLPVAVLHAVEFFAALRQESLSPRMAEALVPTSLAQLKGAGPPKLQRLYGALDIVNLWSALLLGLGFAAATKWKPWRGALLGVVLYALFAGAFLIGLPGMMANGPGGGPPGMGGP